MNRRLLLSWFGCLMLASVAVSAGETIPYPAGITRGGAARYLGILDHDPSPYFTHPDVYAMGNTGSRVVLPHFRTYQQTTEYTCGPAAVVMAADYDGVRLHELEIATEAIGYDDLGTPSQDGDDVLIVADPYDTTDHRQDGYGLVPADRFLSMWFDHALLPAGQREKQWILFTPGAH